jgi:anionic cell wall polymer biosynthesis LytR-Cps2A-Psr (LCP) family protein
MKLLDPTTLVVLPSIINTIDKHTASDFTADQKIAVARFVRGAPKDKVQMETLPSVEGDYYVTTDWKTATPLIKNWFGVTPPKLGHRRHHVDRARLVASTL